MIEKIISIESLKKIISNSKIKGKKVVLCHGVFDLLHLGHIRHFNEAKNLGDVLVVSITSDAFIHKGPNRPAFNEYDRAEVIASLNSINFVVINRNLTASSLIEKLKPNIYCKGPDYKITKNDITGEIKNEIKSVKKIGGKIVYTKDITFSSSKLINKFKGVHLSSKKTLNRIKKNNTFPEIKKYFEGFKKLKVLVIGETIIDQYCFCDALGKSGKEPVLVLRDIRMEEYLGGAAAISRHLSQFCNKITLLSMLGEKGEFLQKIKKNLSKNIKFEFIKKKNSPTILKRRYLDIISKNKVLGVYKINDDILSIKEEQLLNNQLKRLINVHDLIIVSDYGHGFISKKSAELICRHSKYLSLNAQVNAANIGYHSMRKYKNIDCLIINERELRHELRDKNNKIELLVKKLASQQNIKDLIVTRGAQGSMLYNKKEGKFKTCEALAKSAVDKIGAGDAMLSMIALCLKSKLDKDLSLLAASLAAAQSVETIGNSETINKIKILKSINHLLK